MAISKAFKGRNETDLTNKSELLLFDVFSQFTHLTMWTDMGYTNNEYIYIFNEFLMVG